MLNKYLLTIITLPFVLLMPWSVSGHLVDDKATKPIAHAETTDHDWQGSAELGFIVATGNTQSEVVNAVGESNRESGRWQHRIKLAAAGAVYNDIRNTESYALEGTVKYDLYEKKFLFANIRYFDDKFDSFNKIVSGAAGAGFQPLLQDKLTWDVFAGVGYSDQSLEQTGEDISGMTFLAISTYRHQLSDSTTLSFGSLLEYKPENTFSRNEASLKVAINHSLALKVAYELRYNSAPATLDKNIDTLTKANIVYEFH